MERRNRSHLFRRSCAHDRRRSRHYRVRAANNKQKKKNKKKEAKRVSGYLEVVLEEFEEAAQQLHLEGGLVIRLLGRLELARDLRRTPLAVLSCGMTRPPKQQR